MQSNSQRKYLFVDVLMNYSRNCFSGQFVILIKGELSRTENMIQLGAVYASKGFLFGRKLCSTEAYLPGVWGRYNPPTFRKMVGKFYG